MLRKSAAGEVALAAILAAGDVAPAMLEAMPAALTVAVAVKLVMSAEAHGRGRSLAMVRQFGVAGSLRGGGG